LLLVDFGAIDGPRAMAAISIVGEVTPAPPPAGGNVSGTFIVGNASYGQLSVFVPSPPGAATPINVLGGSAIFGDDAKVTGTGAFTGFGNNFTIGTNLSLGNLGSGNLSVSGLARVTAANDIVLGVGDGSSGRLFVNDLGTIVEALNNIHVGQAGTGLVQVLSGGRVFADLTTIGSAATGDGTVTVSGNETLWLQSDTMTVGGAGRGFLQIVSQGRMESTAVTIGSAATGVGSGNVSGTGSVWEVSGAMTVGSSGVGSLNVTEGGRASITGATRLATLAGSEGTILVSGVNSTLNTGTFLSIGEGGTGIMRLIGGGRVNSANSTIGAGGDSVRGEVQVDGVGSVWDVTGTLDISTLTGSEALLSVSSGGLVTTTALARVRERGEIFLSGGRINFGNGITNQGLVQGAGRINGSFTNSLGAEIRTHAGNALILGGLLTNAGTVHLDGGELEVLGSVTNTGDIAVRDGAVRFLNLSNGSGGQLAAVGGDVDFFGTITNATASSQIVIGGEARAVFHDTVNATIGGFLVMPGAEVLLLENLTMAQSALLSLQLDEGALEQDFSPVEVAGQATLAGELKIQLSGGFAPQLGDSYEVLRATGGLTGTFGVESLPALSGGLEWDVNYAPNTLTLSVVSGPGGITADFDGDGDVDGADLVKWEAGFGDSTGAVKGDGDANGDGDVDGRDFLSWQKEFGSGPPATPSASAVPEPSTALLLAATVAFLLGPARRKDRTGENSGNRVDNSFLC
jgi:T5SS/PEP-CTERM-associated repeat protein